MFQWKYVSQHTREFISAENTHKYNNKDLSHPQWLTWYACKYKVHKLHQDVPLVEDEDVPQVEFMYLVFTRIPGESYCRQLRSLLLYLCYTFWALINSLVSWFCTSALGLVLFQIFHFTYWPDFNILTTAHNWKRKREHIWPTHTDRERCTKVYIWIMKAWSNCTSEQHILSDELDLGCVCFFFHVQTASKGILYPWVVKAHIIFQKIIIILLSRKAY